VPDTGSRHSAESAAPDAAKPACTGEDSGANWQHLPKKGRAREDTPTRRTGLVGRPPASPMRAGDRAGADAALRRVRGYAIWRLHAAFARS
jgi:hypothetical protein